MATQEDADRAYAEADEREHRRVEARERMLAQMGSGQMIFSCSTSASKICEIPKCPWCGELFDAVIWELEPSLQGQFPNIDAFGGGMLSGGDHEATCPTCGFVAHFQPKKSKEEGR